MGNNKIPNNIVKVSRYRKRLAEINSLIESTKRNKTNAKTGYDSLIYEEDLEFYEMKAKKIRAIIKKLTDAWQLKKSNGSK